MRSRVAFALDQAAVATDPRAADRSRPRRPSAGAEAVAAELHNVPSFLDRVPPEELERARRELAELPEVAGRPYPPRKRKAPR